MAAVKGTALHPGDIAVIVGYFIGVLFVGLWSSKKSKRDSVQGYFMASRSMHWIPVGASLFASNIGSGHFIGLAGSGAKSGLGIAGFELNAMFVLLILGWIFVPVYSASGVFTMPEYLQKRFGGQRIRVYLSVLALLLYVFTKISADLFAGAIFIEQSLNWNLYISVCVLLAVAAIFTIAGGLSAVIWTDFVQTILMIVGSLALMVLSLIKVGGYNKLFYDFENKQPNNSVVGYDLNNKSCSEVPDNFRHLIRPIGDPELPWTGMVFGLTISAVWYWCSDQVCITVKLSGVLQKCKFELLSFLDKVGCSDPDSCEEICGNRGGCTNIAYPLLVLELMPAGARGLMLSVMLAALMSSLTSIFNSSSTIFTMDIWRRIRKSASEMELLIVGRTFVLVLVVVSILWIPIIQNDQSGQLFHYIQSVTSYLAPPVCAVYVLAIFYTRANEQGAFWGLIIGLIVGLIRFIWGFSYTTPPCADGKPDPRPAVLTDVHYLHFGCILFVISLFVIISVSLLTEPIDEKYLYRLTFWTRSSPHVRENIDNAKAPSETKKQETSEIQSAKPLSTSEPEQGQENLGFDKDCLEMEPVKTYHHTSKKSVPDVALPMWKKVVYLFCGINQDPNSSQKEQFHQLSPKEDAEQGIENIKEVPKYKWICNTNAAILLCVSGFIWGFYA
ncbi:sodium/glucose cotransporter 4-like [Limulus polyphemus]|uniref:Sodium/glucose cotransporter 4-like n=1 Tax=Limulus polyphemus TaxID=6850 RepID=A0ABM1SWT3_LIMPO|nr:sodium/glucose cotransporter 4-like [Limulus polyphemus]